MLVVRRLRFILIVIAAALLLPRGNVWAQQAPDGDPAPADAVTFGETPHWIAGDFRAYWEANGGVARFGLPITPPLIGVDGRIFQWFERARFEHHDELPGDRRVLLGLLGVEVSAGHLDEPAFRRLAGPRGDGGRWFQETGHTLDGLFSSQWEAGGGLPVYGFPISEIFEETNPADGQVYAVQYFERNRFERHRRADGGEFIQFGLLGRQLYPGGGVAARVVPGEPGETTPNLVSTTTFAYYPLDGATTIELGSQMRQRGPKDASGKSWGGMTQQEWNWEYRLTGTAKSCALQSFTVSVETTITMPRWTPPANAAPKLRDQWTTYYNALLFHEDGHRKIGLTAMRRLLQQAQTLPPAPTCPALRATLDNAAKQASAWAEQENIAYDRETQHGLTQGATLR